MQRLRYIISFRWIGTYQDMFRGLNEAPGYTCRQNAYTKNKGKYDYQEQDIYDYILRNFSDAEDNRYCSGSVWDIDPAQLPNTPKTLAWFPDQSKDKYFTIHVSQMGIYLFYNSIGFFWYELEIDKKEQMTEEDLILFQYYLKEINRKERKKNGAVLYAMDPRFHFPVENRDAILRKIAAGDDGFYRFDQKTVTRNGKALHENESEMPGDTVRGTMFRRFTLGHWAAEILQSLTGSRIELKYFEFSTDTMQNENERIACRMIVPEKANLFNYVGIPKEKIDRLHEYAFYLSNGYKRSYLYSENDLREVLFLFANVCCYASHEGCGYYYAPAEVNKTFFETTMKTRIMLDYFLLYILVLHQYYSLIMYAGKIAEELPSRPEDYVQDENTQQKLEDLIVEINTFFIKSVNASVSMMGQQNDFYEYLIERLRIKESVKSVSSGLDAIAAIQRHNQDIREREEQRQREESARQEKEERAEERRRQERKEQQEKEEREEERRRQERKEQQEKEERKEERRRQERKEQQEKEEREEERRRRERKEQQEREEKAEALRIQAQQEKERADLEAQRDRRINQMVAVISILAVISALVDGNQLIVIVEKMINGTAFPKVWQFWGYTALSVLIISAFVYAVITLFKLIRREVKEKDDDKKDG